jgi:MFS family permease
MFAPLSTPSRARRFFLAYAQSSLGTGMSLVALPLVALERHGSAMAVALVLLAELAPLMLAGSWLGGLADRWPRRRCVVGADVLRCAAVAGIVLAPSGPTRANTSPASRAPAVRLAVVTAP